MTLLLIILLIINTLGLKVIIEILVLSIFDVI